MQVTKKLNKVMNRGCSRKKTQKRESVVLDSVGSDSNLFRGNIIHRLVRTTVEEQDKNVAFHHLRVKGSATCK